MTECEGKEKSGTHVFWVPGIFLKDVKVQEERLKSPLLDVLSLRHPWNILAMRD